MSDEPSGGTPNALLAAALRAMAEPVMLYDSERVVFANDAAGRLLGAQSAKQIEGMALDVFLVPELEQVSVERRRYVMGESLELSNLPVKIRMLDGQTLHLQVNIRPVSSDGKTVAIVTLAR